MHNLTLAIEYIVYYFVCVYLSLLKAKGNFLLSKLTKHFKFAKIILVLLLLIAWKVQSIETWY